MGRQSDVQGIRRPMNVMDAEGIRDVLTNDRHFQQEGFNVLIRAAAGETGR